LDLSPLIKNWDKLINYFSLLSGMAWYDPLLIFVFIVGFLLIAFSQYHHRRAFTWGVILMLTALLIKAFLWFESLI